MKLNVLTVACVALLAGCQSTGSQNHTPAVTTSKVNVKTTNNIEHDTPPPQKVLSEPKNIQPPVVLTKDLFYTIVKNAPKGDKFSSSSELSLQVADYLKKYNKNTYKVDVKIENYSADFGYYTIDKNFNSQLVSKSKYTTTNGFGTKVNVTKSHVKSDSLTLENSYLKVPSNVAREIDGKTGVLIVNNLKPSPLYSGALCGTSYFKPTFKFPYEYIAQGCQLSADSAYILVNGKKYELSSSFL